MLKICIIGYLKDWVIAFHFDEFKIRDRNLYYKEKLNNPLMTTTGALRSDGELAARLGKEGLCKIGFGDNGPSGM